MNTLLANPMPPSKASMARELATAKIINHDDVYKLIQPQCKNLVQEVAWAISFDSAGNVLSFQEIGRGAVDHVEVNPRELFRPAIEVAAVGVVLAHYHPSGITTPSEGDRALTRRMLACAEIIGIPLYDHLVVTEKNGYTSLAKSMVEFQVPGLAMTEINKPANPPMWWAMPGRGM